MPKFRKIYSQNSSQSRKNIIFELKTPILAQNSPKEPKKAQKGGE